MNPTESRDRTDNAVILMFLIPLIVFALFILFKPYFAKAQFYFIYAEAYAFVNWLPDFLKDLDGYRYQYSVAAIDYMREYGINMEKVDVSFDNMIAPKYYLLEKTGSVTDMPEILYRLYFWFNQCLFLLFAIPLFKNLYNTYAKKIDKSDIKALGYKQVMLYDELKINERKFNNTADGKVFDVMDYLIPSIKTEQVDDYMKNSLRISLLAQRAGFEGAGKLDVKRYREQIKNKLEPARIEAVKFWEEKLKNDDVFIYSKGDPKKYEALLKEWNKQGDFLTFLRNKGANINPKYKYREERLNFWMRASLTDFILLSEFFLNRLPIKELSKYVTIDFNNDIDVLALLYKEFGFDKTGMMKGYITEQDKIMDTVQKIVEEEHIKEDKARQKVENDINREYGRLKGLIADNTIKVDEGLADYITFTKFYHKKARINTKNHPIPLFEQKEMEIRKRGKVVGKKMIGYKDGEVKRILVSGSDEEKKNLEAAFATHYFPDDLHEQYGRILPPPVYVLTPLRPLASGSKQLEFRIDTKKGKSVQKEYTFQCVGGNEFLRILIDRVFLNFEETVAKSEKQMEEEIAKLENSTDPKDQEAVETLRKLISENRKMVEAGNATARRTKINELLAVHKFEETFLMALLEYGRTLLNLPVGILSAYTKRINPALWYAMTGVGRTFSYNVSTPITAMYRYEKLNADYSLEQMRKNIILSTDFSEDRVPEKEMKFKGMEASKDNLSEFNDDDAYNIEDEDYEPDWEEQDEDVEIAFNPETGESYPVFNYRSGRGLFY